MNDFPKWKYALIAVVILLGFVYALPNVFPPVVAVQISGSHDAKVDEALKEKVLGALQTKKIEFTGVDLKNERLLVRFANADLQLAAQDALKTTLGEEYIIAPNLATTDREHPHLLLRGHARSHPPGITYRSGCVHVKGCVEHLPAFILIRRRHHCHIRNTTQIGQIKTASMSRPVCPN